MKLGELATACGYGVSCNADAVVTGFAIDHRKVAPGTVFGAFQGATVNGEDFIPAAVAAGAIAVAARQGVRRIARDIGEEASQEGVRLRQ